MILWRYQLDKATASFALSLWYNSSFTARTIQMLLYTLQLPAENKLLDQCVRIHDIEYMFSMMARRLLSPVSLVTIR